MPFLRLIKAVALFVAVTRLAQAQVDPKPCSIVNCAEPFVCVHVDPNCPDSGDCVGFCDYRPCEIMDIPDTRSCAPGDTCKEDPRVYSIPEKPRPAICIPDDAPPCGGVVGQPCGKPLECYYPDGGDAGLCLKEKPIVES